MQTNFWSDLFLGIDVRSIFTKRICTLIPDLLKIAGIVRVTSWLERIVPTGPRQDPYATNFRHRHPA